MPSHPNDKLQRISNEAWPQVQPLFILRPVQKWLKHRIKALASVENWTNQRIVILYA